MIKTNDEFNIDINSIIEDCSTCEDLINKIEIRNKNLANQLCDYLIDICYENGIFYTQEEEKKIIENIEKNNKLELLKQQINNPIVIIIMLNDTWYNTNHSLKKDFGLEFAQYGNFSSDMKKYMNDLYNYDRLDKKTKQELLLIKYKRIRYYHTHVYYEDIKTINDYRLQNYYYYNKENPKYINNNENENNNENNEEGILKFSNSSLNKQQKKYKNYIQLVGYLNYKYPNLSEFYIKLFETIFKIESKEDRNNIWNNICNYHQNTDINNYVNEIFERIKNNCDNEYFYYLKDIKNENLKYLQEYKSEVDCKLNKQLKLLSTLKNYNINIYKMDDIMLYNSENFEIYYECFNGMSNDEYNEIMNDIDRITQINTNNLDKYNIREKLIGKTKEYKRYFYKELQYITKTDNIKNIIKMLTLTENDNYLKCLLYGCCNIDMVQEKTEVKCILNFFIDLDCSSLFFIKLLNVMTNVEYNNLVKDFINLYVVRNNDKYFNDNCELLKNKNCKHDNNVEVIDIKEILSIFKSIDRKYTILIIELLKDFVITNKINKKYNLQSFDNIVINDETNSLINNFKSIFKQCGNLNRIINEIEVLGKSNTLELYILYDSEEYKKEINKININYYYNEEMKSVINNIDNIKYINLNFSKEEKNLYNIILDSNINNSNKNEILSKLKELADSEFDIGKCKYILKKYESEICNEITDSFFTIDNNILNDILYINNIEFIDNIKELYNEFVENENKDKELFVQIMKCIFDNTNYISNNNIFILNERLKNCNDNDFLVNINKALRNNIPTNEKRKIIDAYIEENRIENFEYFKEYVNLKSKTNIKVSRVDDFVNNLVIDSSNIDEVLEKANIEYKSNQYNNLYARRLIYDQLFSKYNISDLTKSVEKLDEDIDQIITDIEIDPYSIKIIQKLNEQGILKKDYLIIVEKILNSYFTLLQNYLNNLFENEYLKIDLENYIKENVMKNIKNINKYILQENMKKVFDEYKKYLTKKIELDNIRRRNFSDIYKNAYNLIPTVIDSVKENIKLATKERSKLSYFCDIFNGKNKIKMNEDENYMELDEEIRMYQYPCNRIYIRECYKIVWDILKDNILNMNDCRKDFYLLRGNPGCGKTSFIIYLLYKMNELLSKGILICKSSKDSRSDVEWFRLKEGKIDKYGYQKSNIIICDTYNLNYEDAKSAKICIYISSPDYNNYSHFFELDGNKTHLFFDVFNDYEIKCWSEKCLPKVLRNSIANNNFAKIYGNIPRHIYYASIYDVYYSKKYWDDIYTKCIDIVVENMNYIEFIDKYLVYKDLNHSLSFDTTLSHYTVKYIVENMNRVNNTYMDYISEDVYEYIYKCVRKTEMTKSLENKVKDYFSKCLLVEDKYENLSKILFNEIVRMYILNQKIIKKTKVKKDIQITSLFNEREYGDIYKIAIDEDTQDMIYVYHNIFIHSTFSGKIIEKEEEIPTNILVIMKYWKYRFKCDVYYYVIHESNSINKISYQSKNFRIFPIKINLNDNISNELKVIIINKVLNVKNNRISNYSSRGRNIIHELKKLFIKTEIINEVKYILPNEDVLYFRNPILYCLSHSEIFFDIMKRFISDNYYFHGLKNIIQYLNREKKINVLKNINSLNFGGDDYLKCLLLKTGLNKLVEIRKYNYNKDKNSFCTDINPNQLIKHVMIIYQIERYCNNVKCEEIFNIKNEISDNGITYNLIGIITRNDDICKLFLKKEEKWYICKEGKADYECYICSDLFKHNYFAFYEMKKPFPNDYNDYIYTHK